MENYSGVEQANFAGFVDSRICYNIIEALCRTAEANITYYSQMLLIKIRSAYFYFTTSVNRYREECNEDKFG